MIIYTLHDSVGHLGIFVFAKIAQKQHKQITSVVKTIEALAPGLYEMAIKPDGESYQVSFEARSMADVLALDDGREGAPSAHPIAKIDLTCSPLISLTVRHVAKQKSKGYDPSAPVETCKSKTAPVSDARARAKALGKSSVYTTRSP